MMRTYVNVTINAPLETVWAEAVAFGSHDQWMSDAFSVEFETDQTTGAGTVMLVETRVGALRTRDRFEIVEIEPQRIIRGVHHGSVTGQAEWRLEGSDSVTTFVWTEELTFPWFFGWRVGEWIAQPIFSAMWRTNLNRLKARL
jgi:uncharacterized protein YndB with AHSA1/START domain